MALTYSQIKSLQKGYKVTQTQEAINSGLCWQLEGSFGRFAMSCIDAGVCMLPKARKRDYYGNIIPSRSDLKKGTKGTFQYSCNFWQKVWDGDFEAIEYLEETFGRDEEEEVA